MGGVRRTVRRAVVDHGPASLVIRELVRREKVAGERELRFVPDLCDPLRAFVDVGANRGVYSYVARGFAARAVAIEANPELAAFIRRWSKASVDVHQVGLSDESGSGTLRTPIGVGGLLDGLSSLELAESEYEDSSAQDVRLARLDELPIPSCAFIKIDVEGHESSVLRGARETLARDRPLIQVEIEERHHAGSLEECSAVLASLGYEGHFLHLGVRPLAEFDEKTHQPRSGVRGGTRVAGQLYVNNFYFVADDGQLAALERAVAR